MTKTRFFKNIIIIISGAMFTLLYVHQEVEVVKTSFLINKHRNQVSFLLDQYRSLVYNLSQLESPKRIEDTLGINEISLCVPKLENIYHFDRINFAHTKEKTKKEVKQSFLVRLFDRFSTKAEAKAVH